LKQKSTHALSAKAKDDFSRDRDASHYVEPEAAKERKREKQVII
jgi:hypothetical protein